MKVQSASPVVRSTIQHASAAVKGAINGIDGLTEDQKKKIAEAVDDTDVPVPAAEVPNTLVYWLAVGAVAAVAVFIVIGGVCLAYAGVELPNFLQTALATAIGALAGMVVPSPKTGG